MISVFPAVFGLQKFSITATFMQKNKRLFVFFSFSLLLFLIIIIIIILLSTNLMENISNHKKKKLLIGSKFNAKSTKIIAIIYEIMAKSVEILGFKLKTMTMLIMFKLIIIIMLIKIIMFILI